MNDPKHQDLMDTSQPSEVGPHEDDGLLGIVRRYLIPDFRATVHGVPGIRLFRRSPPQFVTPMHSLHSSLVILGYPLP